MEFSVFNMNGIDIHYATSTPDTDMTAGDKAEFETVMILHGWGVKKEDYGSVVDILSPYMNVIIPDLPGFGDSDEPKRPWNVDDYVDAICALIKSQNIKRLSLIGHSYGGRIIIKMVTRKSLPFDVDKIVLMNSAGIKVSTKKISKPKKLIYAIGKKVLGLGIVKKLFPNALYDLQGKFGSADYRAASPIMRETLVNSVVEDLTPYLASISQPTLLFWGDLDTATPIKHAKIMEKTIPNCGLVVAKGAGHYSFLEQPVLFARVMRSYFNISEKKEEN